ncbi:MAG: hypothetical protein Q7R73_03405 [bacterium]|nr:hypothetical protein [bacterium]
MSFLQKSEYAIQLLLTNGRSLVAFEDVSLAFLQEEQRKSGTPEAYAKRLWEICFSLIAVYFVFKKLRFRIPHGWDSAFALIGREWDILKTKGVVITTQEKENVGALLEQLKKELP